MSKAEKLLQRMKSNPKADWIPDNIKTLCNSFGLVLLQRGTSHAVLTNRKGEHLTLPMHKPVKPLYINRLIELIENAQ
jgi:predicted RNA binding protein YcfA (HicA-like mRNA interferase family)